MIGVLKQAIRDCGVSLGELARQTGVSDGQLSRFIRDERSLTLPAAERLAVYLGLRLVGTEVEPTDTGPAIKAKGK